MFSRNNKNSGASGGNGMQSFTVDYLNDCDLHHEYKGGHVSHCGHCGETYYLDPSHNYKESLKLTLVLGEDGCPFCNNKGGLTKQYLEWFRVNVNKVLQYSFEIAEGVMVNCYRKPYGWKPLNKTQLREAWEDKQAA